MAVGSSQVGDGFPDQDVRDDAVSDGAVHDDSVMLFDVEELNIEWSEWSPEVDYTTVIREAKAGEAVLREMLGRIGHHGSRVRAQSLCTRGGEPVVRADLHPEGWREVAGLVADGERYRRWLARGNSGRV